ncbi:glycosyltransferase family 4 protein [Desulfopila aestuarii]|uniref:Glycosyltransferase involved in cell wall bisynthesis n=1 Tax=Desulfopila aestuarii DSM 18488 TaxID=1121416 RepID=A0A1M7YGR7_9BACT|nr:glycosyltransferase family 4 protein [Desulfopila aestuarii]SHO51718.1 Glycosyltransferase involved in cell wall bisynthesis [Desulfopila aestuarii DSM 18488]
MKILILAPQPFYLDCRISLALKTLLEALAAEGHQPTCMRYPQGKDLVIPGCQMMQVRKLPLPGFSWKKPFYSRTMAKMTDRLLQHEKFDFLIAFAGCVGLTRRLSKRYNIPYLLYLDHPIKNGTPDPSFVTTLKKWSVKRAITQSRGVLVSDDLLEDKVSQACPSAVVQRLPNVSLYDNTPKAEKTRKNTLAKPRGALTLMYLGDLSPQNGINLLIDTFSLACLEKEKLRLIILGTSTHDISSYKTRARKLGVAGKIKFVQTKPGSDLPVFLDQADILIFPATDASILPYEFATCLDSGRPVIATRISMHNRVLDDSTAMLVNPVDSDMAVAIQQLIRDSHLKAKLAAQAKVKVVEEYSRTTYHHRLRSFFQRVSQQLIGAN